MPQPHEAIPLAVLPELLEYNPNTGELRWLERQPRHFTDGGAHQSAEQKCRRWNAQFAGKVALQRLNAEGYRHGKLLKVDVQTHRIVWALNYGEWPNVVDHINGNRADNRLVNLRSVDHTDNCRNSQLPRTNTSGVAGVVWHSRDKKWFACIRIGGNRREYLGYFNNFDDAVAARKEAERRHGYHPNHGRENASAA